MTSELFRLGQNDYVKGFIVAVLSAVLLTVQQMLTSGFDLNQIVHVGATAGIGYLIKNFLTDSDGKVVGIVG